jgi:hypothetical protein
MSDHAEKIRLDAANLAQKYIEDVFCHPERVCVSPSLRDQILALPIAAAPQTEQQEREPVSAVELVTPKMVKFALRDAFNRSSVEWNVDYTEVADEINQQLATTDAASLPRAERERVLALEQALSEADKALSTWFSSEYIESDVAKKVRKVLYKL